MAARKRKVQHDDATREKIRTSQLLNRLHAYALSEKDPQTQKAVKLETGQVRAIEILLRKSMPDLSQVEGTLEHNVRSVEEMSDTELAAVASGSSYRAATPSRREEESDQLH